MLDFGQRESMPMAEETTYEFLRRREQELAAQITALRGQLAPKEAELASIRQMKALLESGSTATVPNVLPQRTGNSIVDGLRTITIGKLGLAARGTLASGVTPFDQMTIKELIIQALLDGFPHGAQANEIRAFIHKGYGRSVEPTSFRPQLHRLKVDGIIRQNGLDDSWNLDPEKRQIYSRYSHPSSRRAMKELQDEPDDPEKPSGS
jgi:hypothetical protein